MKNWFDLPPEVFGTLPRIEWIGQQLQIENFTGVQQFRPDTLTLQTATGLLTITGTKLELVALYPNRVLLTGKIAGVQMKTKD